MSADPEAAWYYWRHSSMVNREAERIGMPQVSPAEALQVAMQCHRNGRLAEARQQYEQLLMVDPGNADALHLLGLVAYQTGDSIAAEKLIRQAIAVDSG